MRNRSLGAFAKRLAAERSGAAIIEFALVALPLSMLIMGGLDLGHQSYIRATMQGALNDAARRAAVQDPAFTASGATTEARVRNTIKETLDPITPNATIDITMRSYFDFTGIGSPEKLMTDVNGNGQYDETQGDCFSDLDEDGEFDENAGKSGIGGANDVVFYTARITMPRLFPVAGLLGFPSNYDMSVSTAIRNQPYGTQKTPPVVCGTPA
ncbi:TadE/TadG family type IV pilus assembly protein [Croceibacterium aestuarii]|uniref:TadE/TadG family type IV pilus assembly protein n=1 Tax=Croceibacterium aestuarii TaxID=3064139 RepID=UPI00272DEF5E|nr:TadE/TadG family type IV pilus assembly protein [Croceibacterium sp. D39]